MPVYRLGREKTLFPPVEEAEPDGLLAVGGDLSPERLIAAYSQGIFPWYSEGSDILWFSPHPRFALKPQQLHVPQSLRKQLKRGKFEVRFDTAFSDVINACARIRRPGQRGTWITKDMQAAYRELHQLGLAHSIEAYSEDALVGGLYGVSFGRAFFGESMFALAPDASKVAFVTLAETLQAWEFSLIDCQQETEHLARFGATLWPREVFLKSLEEALSFPTRQGSWNQAD